MQKPKPTQPRRLQIPLPFRIKKPIGLGDAVKRATTAIGIKPCSGCGRRAAVMNRVVLVPKKSR
jgi:hypothetical protein